MSRLAAQLMRTFEAHHGFPPGDNIVTVADHVDDAAGGLAAAGVPGDLVDFYSVVGEVSLPDVDNGFFIHSARTTMEGMAQGVLPTQVSGTVTDAVTVFGSDGGGALFALTANGDRVYRLQGGSLVGSTYQLDDHQPDVIAQQLWDFLEHLRVALAGSLPPT